ncbi:helix-turn-helix transcriptional regulator [Streptomyces celluloflavus]
MSGERAFLTHEEAGPLPAPPARPLRQPAAAPHADPVEQVLLHTRDLVDTAVSALRSLPDQRLTALPARALAAPQELVAHVVGGARRTVTAALPGGPELLTVLRDALERHPTAADRPPLTVRLLVAGRLPVWLPPRITERAGVRSAGCGLTPTVVVDGRTALVWSEAADDDGAKGLLVRDEATVRSLGRLVDSAWAAAQPWADSRQLDGYLHTEIARQVLQRLRLGVTDAVAAREMAVSLRTYRRHVAEIMRCLDARTRFEAGVRAVESRLL